MFNDLQAWRVLVPYCNKILEELRSAPPLIVFSNAVFSSD